MSRKYERKTLRASWSAEDLDEAMRSVQNKSMGINEASRNFNIPSRTLRRHLRTGRSKVPLGRNPVFSRECEKKLVAHIKKLERVGFAPGKKDVKEMAFQLAKSLNIKSPFSEDSEAAGNVWFTGFMTRNPELSQRKSEGLSLSRAYGVNREDVRDFFNLLSKIYEENDFTNHPEDVFNMDETGIQINNKPGTVVATKGARDVYTLTSSEKGENVTVIACCNAAGNFLPPVLIYKGTYNKPQFSEGLPPGSNVFMNKKSSYINTDLFMKWFEEVFLRHKSSRKTLLIWDGHSSHSNNIRLLEVAKENQVTLLCLPSHTTHVLQPLDRAFFRPLKTYFAQETKAWMIRSKDKKLTRYDVSKLIGRAWGKAATISNGVSALKSCGIYPFDPTAIPDHYFALSDSLKNQNSVTDDGNQTLRESPSLLDDNIESLLIHDNDIFCKELALPTLCTNKTLSENSVFCNENKIVTTATVSSPHNLPQKTIADDAEEQTSTDSNLIQLHELNLNIHQYATTSQEMSPTRDTFESMQSLELSQGDICNENFLAVANIHSSPCRQRGSAPSLLLESRFTRVNPSTLCDDSALNLIEQEIASLSQSGQSVTKNNTTKTPQKISLNINSGNRANETEKSKQETPTKLLSAIYPIPIIPVMASKRKQKAIVLTSTENIEKRKEISNKKKPKAKKSTRSPNKIKVGEMKATKQRINPNTIDILSANKDPDIENNENLKQTIKKTGKKGTKDGKDLSNCKMNISEEEKKDNDGINNFRCSRKPKKRKSTDKNKKEDSTDMSENELSQVGQVKRQQIKTAKKIKRTEKIKRQSKTKKVLDSSSSETVNEDITDVSEEELSDMDENKCIECTENYYKTKSSEDWIKCAVCSGWLHEFCTMYGRLCNICGRKAKREAIRDRN